jgi:hypothetical protein
MGGCLEQEQKIKELTELLKRKNWLRASRLASELGRPKEEVRLYQEAALWQLSAVNRNGAGTKRLASDLGINKEELIKLLERLSRENGRAKELEPCYDPVSEAYLDFNQWLEVLQKRWERL